MGTEAPPKARVQIEAVQTVTPWRSLGARRPRRVAASSAALAEAMQARACVVLVYGRPVEDGTGWNLAGRLKESLNVALSDHPLAAGRLRRVADGGVEVRLTDSGVRLVQARAGAPMAAFVGGGAAAARELAYWGDVEEKNLEYSPLVFVQLTVFEGQGYSIGVSGSLLATDPLLLSGFLKAWSDLHVRMRFPAPSIFHLSKFRRPSSVPDLLPALASPLLSHRTLFLASAHPDALPQHLILFSNDPSGDLTVESREEGMPLDVPAGGGTEEVDWIELVGLDEVEFEADLRPVHAFCFLDSHVARGIAVVMPECDGFEGAVAVAVPEAAAEC